MKNLSYIQHEDISNFDGQGETVLTLYPNGLSELQTTDERFNQIKKSQLFDLIKRELDTNQSENELINRIKKIVNAISN